MKFALIAEIVDQKPFRPFVVTTSTGDAVRVPRREHCFLAPSRREVFVYDAERHLRILDVRHVVRVERERTRKR